MHPKTTFLLLLLAFTLPSMAQLKKGQWIVGGIGAFSHSSSDNDFSSYKTTAKSTSIGVSVGAAYFFIDRLAGGLRPAVTSSDSKEESTGIGVSGPTSYSSKEKATAYAISPFVRYYFLPNGNKINILADISWAYSYSKQSREVFQTFTNPGTQFPSISANKTFAESKSSIYTLSAGPAIFLSSNVSLELTVGYTFEDVWDREVSASGLQISTGFQYHFGKGRP